MIENNQSIIDINNQINQSIIDINQSMIENNNNDSIIEKQSINH